MAAPLIAITGLIYALVAIDLASRGRYDLATAYIGYVIANCGLFFAAKN
jgi:hypothetical protein